MLVSGSEKHMSGYKVSLHDRFYIPSIYRALDHHRIVSVRCHSVLYQISIFYTKRLLHSSFMLPTLNVTINPVSHTLSLLTLVRFNGVFSGFPPFGGASVSSGYCAYNSRNARVRSPFCSGVTVGRNLKHAMRVTGRQVVESDAMAGLGEEKRAREANVMAWKMCICFM